MDTFKIVVGIDFSDTSDVALTRAIDLARRQASSEIHVLHVLDDVDHDLGRLDTAAARLHALLGRTYAREIARTFVHVRIGSPALEIVKLAADVRADLVAVGTHGRRGLSRLWVGSVAERVVRLSRCPVIVARPVDYAEVEEELAIEPPCANCIIARTRSEGREWWCEEHANATESAHRYGYSSTFDRDTNAYNKVW